jgi:hypothetical protein
VVLFCLVLLFCLVARPHDYFLSHSCETQSDEPFFDSSNRRASHNR